MLSKQDHDRSQVTGSTRETSGLFSLFVRMVCYKVDENLNPRPDEATREKWRILDVNGESGLILDSELQDGSPCLC
jgi:hypothetical protein